MKKIIVTFLSLVIFAFSAVGICAGAEEASAETQTAAAETASTEASQEEAESTDREAEEDPFVDADGFDIPKSFYIGGGVLVVFVIASIVVLIMGKPKEK